MVDITRQNLSLLTGAGDLISTTRDLRTFFSALLGGRLLPAPLLDQLRTPYGKLGYGLGVFVQDLGPGCGARPGPSRHNQSTAAGSRQPGTRRMTAARQAGRGPWWQSSSNEYTKET